MKLFGFILIVLFSSFGNCWSQVNTNAHEAENNILLIPNAFTPNGDGLNDVFRIHNITNQIIVDFVIFNRWGTVMYRSNSKDAAWDGTYKNIPQESGVFGYNIQIQTPETEKINIYKGTVTLLR